MKICKNCGHENPDNRTTCEACHRSLADKKPEYINMETIRETHDRPTDRKASNDFNPKATLREDALNTVLETQQGVCPNCGMPLENGVCPRCGEIPSDSPAGTNSPESHPSPAGHAAKEARQTVRPQRKGEKEGSFTLTPISEKTGKPEGEPLQFEGNEVTLNRDNTDPKNKTITSKEQALIRHENGEWTIKDSSDYKTTFVQASEGIALRPGSIILLGNQLYEFNA